MPRISDLAAAVHESDEHVRRVLRKQATQGTVCQAVCGFFYDVARASQPK